MHKHRREMELHFMSSFPFIVNTLPTAGKKGKKTTGVAQEQVGGVKVCVF